MIILEKIDQNHIITGKIYLGKIKNGNLPKLQKKVCKNNWKTF